MVLSHLSTKDLTRALTVSKHWQKSILGPVLLRRNLFIEAAPKQEYLDYAKGEDGQRVPSILHEPNKNSKTIVEPHPILPPHSEPGVNARISIEHLPCDVLCTVQPSAFLVQPPLEEVNVIYYMTTDEGMIAGITSRDVKRTSGVTFGAILEELVSLRPRQVNDHCYMGFKKEEKFCLNFAGVIANNARVVKTAREALMKAQSPANLDKLKMEQTV